MAMNERPIPEAALRDKDSVEMLRVWIAEEQLHCSIKVGMYKETTSIPEEKAWGIILADVVLHLGRAFELQYSASASATVSKIRENFLAALDRPSAPPMAGGFTEVIGSE